MESRKKGVYRQPNIITYRLPRASHELAESLVHNKWYDNAEAFGDST